MDNWMELTFPSLSVNEGFARAAAAAFAALLNPTIDELSDLRTAVSEAVTNAIVHGYREYSGTGVVTLTVSILDGRCVKIEVKDKGCGIPDVKTARQPLYTTDAAGERSGIGFTVMESFTDSLRVTSKPGKGTTVTMLRRFGDRGRI